MRSWYKPRLLDKTEKFCLKIECWGCKLPLPARCSLLRCQIHSHIGRTSRLLCNKETITALFHTNKSHFFTVNTSHINPGYHLKLLNIKESLYLITWSTTLWAWAVLTAGYIWCISMCKKWNLHTSYTQTSQEISHHNRDKKWLSKYILSKANIFSSKFYKIQVVKFSIKFKKEC